MLFLDSDTLSTAPLSPSLLEVIHREEGTAHCSIGPSGECNSGVFAIAPSNRTLALGLRLLETQAFRRHRGSSEQSFLDDLFRLVGLRKLALPVVNSTVTRRPVSAYNSNPRDYVGEQYAHRVESAGSVRGGDPSR